MKLLVLLITTAVVGLPALRPGPHSAQASAIATVAAVAAPITMAADRGPLLQAPDGKARYTDLCKKCHGVLGSPPQTMKKKYPKIAAFDQKFLEKVSEDSVVTVLTKGKGEDMESVKDKATAAEIRAIAKYVRELAARPKPGAPD